jgi:hypothetical protein
MSYTPGKVNSAERRRFVEIAQSDVPALTALTALTALEESSNPTNGPNADSRVYAQVIQKVNTDSAVSGTLGFNTLENITRQRKTAELAGIVEPAFNYVSEEDGNIKWEADAPPGSDVSDPVWRIKKTTTLASSPVEILNVELATSGQYVNTAISPLSGAGI